MLFSCQQDANKHSRGKNLMKNKNKEEKSRENTAIHALTDYSPYTVSYLQRPHCMLSEGRYFLGLIMIYSIIAK